MPNVLRTPPLRESAYFLRPPAPPPSPEDALPPAVYTEEEMTLARARAEEAGRAAARAVFDEACRALAETTEVAAGEMRDAARALREEQRALLTGAAEQVLDLAFEIGRRVVRSEIEADRDVVLPLVRELLQRVATAETVTVRLSARDHGHLLQHKSVLAEVSGLEGLRLRADAAVRDGGCVVETEAGSLDGQVETQLARIEEALRAARRVEEAA